MRPSAAVTEVAATAEPAEQAPRLRHEPALDGLRGLAVAVVFAFHLDHLQGGFLGVDLFFVLSGFLITSLLLVEHGGRGAIRLGRFWSRRARRLLPALFLLLAGVAVLIATATPAGERPTIRGEALATLGYVANWQAMGDDLGYWDIFTQPSPLDHMWSLAIEEQFYVLWPLVVVGVLALARRARMVGPMLVARVAGAGAVASFVVLAVTYSPLDTSRAYYGTDARVGPTLLGAALAGLSAERLRRRAAVPVAPGLTARETSDDRSASRWAPLAGLAALAVMVWALASVDGIGPTYYRGGLVAFAAASVVVVHLVTSGRGGLLASALSVRPLAALGVISYGVYLWHWPVIVYATPERTGLDSWALDAVRIAATLVAAVASYVVVERPIRRGALRAGAVRLALVGSVAALCAAVLVVTSGTARVPGAEVAMGASGSGVTVYPDEIPAGATRILLVGDSGPTFLAPALAAEAERAGAVVASDSQPFCTVLSPEAMARWSDGRVTSHTPCHDERRAAWSELVSSFDPDVVVYYIAAGGGVAELRYKGEWVTECDDAYRDYLRDALRQDVDVLSGGGATVALATTPEAPFVVGLISEVTDESLDGLECRRETLDAVVGSRPAAAIVDMAAVLRDAEGEDAGPLYRDGIHLSDEGAELVSGWLVPTAKELAR